MKKFLLILVAVTFVSALFLSSFKEEKTIENRGVFISYLEYQEYLKGLNKEEIKEKIGEMVNNLDKYKINTIYLQVRMFSDSIYKSKIFPFTDTIASYQGENIGVDVLATFIKYAKEKNISIYAWINPYRISLSTDVSRLSKANPAYSYLNTNHVKIIDGKGIYYNPSSKVVRDLIIDGIREIIDNYDIKGIIFDDYFYPNDDIDIENYNKDNEGLSLKDYHLKQVNDLVSNVYKEIKNMNKDILFGISPNGNIENNYDNIYADVKKWLSEDGYIDFIIPQIYYGFYNETKPFIRTVNEWNDLIKNDTNLIVGLALYKAGNIDEYAKSGINEWIDYQNIISREIEYARTLSNYKGYSIFRYQDLIDANNKIKKEEVKNYLNFLKNKY